MKACSREARNTESTPSRFKLEIMSKDEEPTLYTMRKYLNLTYHKRGTDLCSSELQTDTKASPHVSTFVSRLMEVDLIYNLFEKVSSCRPTISGL